jgi:hypothetical protein
MEKVLAAPQSAIAGFPSALPLFARTFYLASELRPLSACEVHHENRSSAA